MAERKRREVSKYLGGMAGKAAARLRGRQRDIDAAIARGTGTTQKKNRTSR